jgi:hypothetical protein
MSERRIKKKWGFADAVWEQLGEDDGLVEAICPATSDTVMARTSFASTNRSLSVSHTSS